MEILPAIIPLLKEREDESLEEAPSFSSIPSNIGKIFVTNNIIIKDIIIKSIAG